MRGKPQIHRSVISNFRREVDENCALFFWGGGGFSTPEDGTDRLSRNVGKNYYYSLRNNPEEGSSHKPNCLVFIFNS